MKDLFGNEVDEGQFPVATVAKDGKRKSGQPNGYAKNPGSGPAGETCGTCLHACKINYHNKAYHKCGVIHHRWTHGPGTDIRLKAPACSMWKPKASAE